jgi:tripartite-type tricarboxylate transporter receptor subunit TctC
VKLVDNFRRALAFCVLVFAPPVAGTETFPDKSIRMIVPFAPGGISDVAARTIAEHMTDALSQTVIVDNRGGAGGNIGTRIAARAAAVGYTMLFCAPAFATTLSLSSQAGFDPVKDFAPVAQVASATNILVVAPQTGVKSVAELIATARTRPSKINYGSGGAGTSGQLAAELFKLAVNVTITHVPYTGAGPALTGLLGNEIQLMFLPIVLAMPHLANGRLVPLAVSSAQRSRVVPDVPTIAEAAIPDFDVTSWFGIVVPVAVSRERRNLLHKSVVAALQNPVVAKRLMAQGAEPTIKSSDDFGRYVNAEVAKWAEVVKRRASRPIRNVVRSGLRSLYLV